MTIYEFNECFPDEHSCRMDFKLRREKEGLTCRKCGGSRLNFLEKRYAWHCNDCKFRTTLRSGTVMHDSKLPVRTWYKCMALMMMTKKGISSHEMRRQLVMKNYRPVWEMMHKIRAAMGQRDDLYGLKDMIEFDEGHFRIPAKKGTKIKRGNGSQRTATVAVMAESTPLEDPITGKKSSHCRYFKMKVLPNQKAESVNHVVSKNLDEETIVFSDKAKNFIDISNFIEGHVTEYSSEHTSESTLKWVHIAISNAKRMFLGIYHWFHGSNLQNYLNEFCYKLNRRYFNNSRFDRLAVAIASSKCTQTT